MYQTTIKIEGFVTVTSQEPITADDIGPVVLDVFDEEAKVSIEINETEVTKREITTVVPC